MRLLALPIAVLVIVAAACTDDSSAADDPVQRDIDIYSAAIQAVVIHERPDLAALDELENVVYVAPRDGAEVSIDVQLGVVNALEEWANIRFIDEFDEAIDEAEPNRPVRDAGVLVGLGEIPAGTAAVELLVDRYERSDRLLVFDLSLQRRASEWSVVGPIVGTYVSQR